MFHAIVIIYVLDNIRPNDVVLNLMSDVSLCSSPLQPSRCCTGAPETCRFGVMFPSTWRCSWTCLSASSTRWRGWMEVSPTSQVFRLFTLQTNIFLRSYLIFSQAKNQLKSHLTSGFFTVILDISLIPVKLPVTLSFIWNVHCMLLLCRCRVHCVCIDFTVLAFRLLKKTGSK